MSFIKRYRLKAGEPLHLRGMDANPRKDLPGTREAAREALPATINRLSELQEALYAEHRRPVLVILQAMDTGGKDGSIRHVFSGVNPAGLRVSNFKAPNPTELDHDYLWRIHRRVPERGEIGVFNRSHYEDVLVPRVNGWLSRSRLKQRFTQINDFERMLVEEGTTMVKMFLHIDRDEQKRRLVARRDNPHKQWKITQSDLDDRKRWDDFQEAYEDLLIETNTKTAPWHLIPANSKAHRNLIIARILVEILEGLDIQVPKPTMSNLQNLKIE